MAHSDGQIQVIIGPMFSGKSTEMMRRIRKHAVAGRVCAVVKYVKDTRYSPSIENVDRTERISATSNGGILVTHDRVHFEAFATNCLSEFQRENESIFSNLDVIGIDEGQFFPDIVKYAEYWANLGIVVIIAALAGTFQRNPFNDVLNLIPLAETVDKLTSVCYFCKKEASFTLRIGTEQQVELIGGEDKYHAACRTCYFERK
jgi:thymidine kinase